MIIVYSTDLPHTTDWLMCAALRHAVLRYAVWCCSTLYHAVFRNAMQRMVASCRVTPRQAESRYASLQHETSWHATPSRATGGVPVPTCGAQWQVARCAIDVAAAYDRRFDGFVFMVILYVCRACAHVLMCVRARLCLCMCLCLCLYACVNGIVCVCALFVPESELLEEGRGHLRRTCVALQRTLRQSPRTAAYVCIYIYIYIYMLYYNIYIYIHTSSMQQSTSTELASVARSEAVWPPACVLAVHIISCLHAHHVSQHRNINNVVLRRQVVTKKSQLLERFAARPILRVLWSEGWGGGRRGVPAAKAGRNRFGSIRLGSGLFEHSSVRFGSVRKKYLPAKVWCANLPRHVRTLRRCRPVWG